MEEKDVGGGGGYLFIPQAVCLQQSDDTMKRKCEDIAKCGGYEPGGISRPDIRHFGPGAFPILRTGLDGSSWSEDCGIVLLCAFG